jgi:hypothetical protein
LSLCLPWGSPCHYGWGPRKDFKHGKIGNLKETAVEWNELPAWDWRCLSTKVLCCRWSLMPKVRSSVKVFSTEPLPQKKTCSRSTGMLINLSVLSRWKSSHSWVHTCHHPVISLAWHTSAPPLRIQNQVHTWPLLPTNCLTVHWS